MQVELPAYRRREGRPPQQLSRPRKTAQEGCWSEPCVPIELTAAHLGVGGELGAPWALEGPQMAGLRCRAVEMVI